MKIISHSQQSEAKYWKRSRWFWLMPLLLAGFWLRITFLVGNIYYGDEFISMLAAKMVAERGWPIFPSGLFYDHGLPYSLMAGGFIALLGFSEQIARWPVLLVSILTIAAYYTVARQLFDSPMTGIIAAILVTFDTFMMKWGVWARMYALAHLFVLLSVAWLVLSTLKRPNYRGRYLFLIFLAGALFSHSLTFLLLPPLALLLLIFTVTYRPDWLQSRGVWLQAIIAGLIMLAALALAASGHVSSTISLQDRAATTTTMPLGLNFLQGFFLVTFDNSEYKSLFNFFRTPAYNWLLFVIGLALLPTLYRVVQRAVKFVDVVYLFLLLLPLLVIFEMGTILTEAWVESRYMFFLALPAFMLLSAEALARLLRGVLYLISRLDWRLVQGNRLQIAAPLIVLGIIAIVWGRPTWDLASVRATGDYDTAYDFVRAHWQPGDRIMTEFPAAAWLYMGQNDFYANQTSAKVLNGEENDFDVIDRYTGAPLIDTVAKLNEALATGGRIWLVVGDKHLLGYYAPLFRQQIFAQMDLAYQAGTKYVFTRRAYPIPLPAEPMMPLDGNFDNSIRLAGYSLDLSTMTPDGTVSLALYWRPIGSPQPIPPKVFVQLRDSQNRTIAQADHFIYEQLLTGREWNDLRERGEWLRDTADLPFPLPLSPDDGPYRIYIGFYHPDTFERTPLINDTSGENAVVIDLSTLPNILAEAQPSSQN